MKYDKKEMPIIQFLQADIPLQSHPFKELAANLAMSEVEVLKKVTALQTRGIMRRWGAVLQHHKAGYTANAMVAWQVDPARADQVGEIMAGMTQISHCYLREVCADFDYNMFSMVHARNAQELDNTIRRVAELTGLDDFTVLKSVREFKKVSMRYL
jgi:DNA-binding Lrp family transcriptional regulator